MCSLVCLLVTHIRWYFFLMTRFIPVDDRSKCLDKVIQGDRENQKTYENCQQLLFLSVSRHCWLFLLVRIHLHTCFNAVTCISLVSFYLSSCNVHVKTKWPIWFLLAWIFPYRFRYGALIMCFTSIITNTPGKVREQKVETLIRLSRAVWSGSTLSAVQMLLQDTCN